MLGSTTFDERSSCPSLLGCDDDSSDLSNGSYQRASHQFRLEFSGGDDDLDLCILMYLHSLTFLWRPREYTYKIGNFSMKSNYYQKFLHPQVCERVYQISRNKKSMFRSRFRVPLFAVDELTDLLYEGGAIKETKSSQLFLFQDLSFVNTDKKEDFPKGLICAINRITSQLPQDPLSLRS